MTRESEWEEKKKADITFKKMHIIDYLEVFLSQVFEVFLYPAHTLTTGRGEGKHHILISQWSPVACPEQWPS